MKIAAKILAGVIALLFFGFGLGYMFAPVAHFSSITSPSGGSLLLYQKHRQGLLP